MTAPLIERARSRRQIALRTLQTQTDQVEPKCIPLMPKSAVAQDLLETMRSNPMNTMFMAI